MPSFVYFSRKFPLEPRDIVRGNPGSYFGYGLADHPVGVGQRGGKIWSELNTTTVSQNCNSSRAGALLQFG
jgi:hypothetical protein